MRSYAKTLAVLAAMFTLTTAGQALAADVTDVLDAADEVYLGTEKVKDPIDISLTPKFFQRYEWSKLKREYVDGSNDIRLLNELEHKRILNEFDIGLEVGMYHDLSFRMNVPIIISDQQTYKFDTSSNKVENHISDTGTVQTVPDPDNPGQMMDVIYGMSSLAPADSRIGDDRPYQFFKLGKDENLKGANRVGLGDLSFGIAWSPYNTERHFIPERPWEHNTGRSTVTLAFDYKAPTGKVKGIDNTYVGSGAHELLFTVAASHRFSFVDPYIRLQYGLPIALDSAYPDYSPQGNQTRKGPGMWGRIDLGIEFIPYESIDVKFQRNVKIDLRGYFKYTAEGRAYSELSDALGTSDCVKSGVATGKCGWLAEKWSNAGKANIENVANGRYNGTYKEDGLFDYEGFASVGGALNLSIQPIQYVAIIAGVAADYTQNHFITFTKIGKDRVTADDDGNLLDVSQKDGVVTDTLYQERNPTFSGALDRVGQRIKRTEQINLEWFVGLRLMY